MKTCSKCGRSIKDSASFCPFCGTKAPAVCAACGAPLKPGAKFCSSCGAKVGDLELPAAPPAELPPEPERALPEEESSPLPAPPPEDAAAAEVPSEEEETAPPADQSAPPPEARPSAPDRRKRALYIALPVLIVLLGGLLFGWRWYSNQALARELTDEAAQYMEDGKYRQAQDKYQELLELRPNSQEAAMGLARACLHQEKFEEAAQYLEGLELPQTSEQYESWQRLLAIAQFDPEAVEINADHFPQVDLILRGGGTLRPTEEEITVLEDGQPYALSACTAEEGALSLSYLAPDTEFSNEERTVSVSLDLDGVVLSRDGVYYTPAFEPAQVRLVSTDVSEYPLVTAYFRVEGADGTPIEDLDAASFRISERLQGGQYLSREVRSAEPLKGNQGLSIDLVADKSSSIRQSDMQKIKRVMSDFVNSLHFEEGDKAEVLAFDSIVQQMCCYTDDPALLSNGIQNMSTDGMTALYNAIHDGIHNAALQGGARCVIAFTDGIDNESWYSPGEIIQYANDSQVPVYIIGVGWDVETNTLRAVAEGTGGRYWFIDDLYDLQEIFNEIYAEQKKLYAVKYASDESADAYADRELEVSVNGGGYRGKAQTKFQAARSVSGESHASRYELVKGGLSWEDAAKRCLEMGGHLVTITSQSEMDAVVAMAEAEGLRYIWLGGYTSYDGEGNVFGHWVTGENFDFQSWSPGEPSRVDLDGVDEWYIMLWNIPSLGGWTWNDQRNDPASVIPTMSESMGFICEYENGG